MAAPARPCAAARRSFMTSHAPHGTSTRLAPQMRAKARSKGVSERAAEARAIRMKAVHTSTVTTAAPMPSWRAERRGKKRAAAGIPGLSGPGGTGRRRGAMPSG